MEKFLTNILEKLFGKLEDPVNYLGGKKEKE
jgi:hypothetical protein